MHDGLKWRFVRARKNDVELTSLSMFEDGVQRFFGTFQSKK